MADTLTVAELRAWHAAEVQRWQRLVDRIKDEAPLAEYRARLRIHAGAVRILDGVKGTEDGHE